MSNFGHGAVGTRERDFTALLPLRAAGYPKDLLLALAGLMKGNPDSVKDGSDPEENLWVPSGYTYFGQFIDHDLTFDNTSSLNPADAGSINRLPSNLRTPRFDLDSVYGDGPDAQPFMYGEDGASLLFKDGTKNQVQPTVPPESELIDDFAGQAEQDLFRSPNGRAIIGDKRNDENSIISQIQLTFVKFHNAVVAQLKTTTNLEGTALFEAARNEVRWAYQKLVIKDFLPRIVKAEVLEDLQKSTTPQNRQGLYALYTDDKRSNLPREFVVAAYRFGHSGVRSGYRLNGSKTDPGKSLNIFPASDDDNSPAPDSLLGFEPLPAAHVIDDWARFFPSTKPIPLVLPSEDRDSPAGGTDSSVFRLQFAYKIDTTLVDPLGVLPPEVLPTSSNPKGALQEVNDTISPHTLPPPTDRPSLALLNLLRGNTYKVQGGQAFAKRLQTKGFRENGFPIEPLHSKYLSIRTEVGKGTGIFKFVPIDPTLAIDTPLWFYILAEGQVPLVDKFGVDREFSDKELLEGVGSLTQLGWVGGRIVAEVFYGLMDADPESYVHQEAAHPDWQPIWVSGGDREIIFANLLKFAGQPIGVTP